jgi:hypothetical protein
MFNEHKNRKNKSKRRNKVEMTTCLCRNCNTESEMRCKQQYGDAMRGVASHDRSDRRGILNKGGEPYDEKRGTLWILEGNCIIVRQGGRDDEICPFPLLSSYRGLNYNPFFAPILIFSCVMGHVTRNNFSYQY